MRTHLPVLLQQAEVSPTHQVENDKVQQQLNKSAGNSQEANLASLPVGLLCQLTKSFGVVPFIRLSTSLDTDIMIPMKPALHSDCGQASKLTPAKPHGSDEKTLTPCCAPPCFSRPFKLLFGAFMPSALSDRDKDLPGSG